MNNQASKSPVDETGLAEAFEEDTEEVSGSNDTTFNPETLQRVKEALGFIDPNISREAWVKVGMALKSEFGDDGVDIFNEWSEDGHTYKWEDFDSTWDSITQDGGISIGTLFHMAKEGGYTPSGKPLTVEEREAYAVEREEREEQHRAAAEEVAKAKLTKQIAAAGNAKGVIEFGSNLPVDEHPYVIKKGIVGFGSSDVERFEKNLRIPMIDEKGEIWNVETINEDGSSKKGLKDGRRKGLFHITKGKGDIVISEGWATSVSIFAATGYNSVCAFSKSNLMDVAKVIKRMEPKERIIIAGDVGSEESAVKVGMLLDVVVAIPPSDVDGYDFNDLHVDKGLAEVRKCIQSAGDTWPKVDPLRADIPEVMEFDSSMLPAGLAPWVEDVAERMQSPVDYVGAAAMYSASVLMGRKVGVFPKAYDDWLVIPNLWGAAIGIPSQKKTPAISSATKPLKVLEGRARKEYQEALVEYEVDLEFSEQSKKVSKENIKTAVKSGDSKKMADAKQAAMVLAGEDNSPPTQKRYTVNDATVEKLGELLNENTNGLGLLRDELTGWLKNLDREDKSSDRAFYLEAFNGNGDYTYDRIGRGTIYIESTTVSVFGGIQPAKIRPYIFNAINQNSNDDGLIQRLQLMVYPNPITKFVHMDKPVNTVAQDKASQVYEDLDDFIICKNDYGDVAGVRFDAEGQKLFDEWYVANENRVASEELHPAIASHFGKYGSLVASLALITNEIEVGHYTTITKDSVAKALKWVEYLESHAMRIYGDVVSPVIHTAELILAKKAHLPDGFTIRSIRRKGWAGLSSTEEIGLALSELIECGYLRITAKDSGKVGRPTLKYRWNPNL